MEYLSCKSRLRCVFPLSFNFLFVGMSTRHDSCFPFFFCWKLEIVAVLSSFVTPAGILPGLPLFPRLSRLEAFFPRLNVSQHAANLGKVKGKNDNCNEMERKERLKKDALAREGFWRRQRAK